MNVGAGISTQDVTVGNPLTTLRETSGHLQQLPSPISTSKGVQRGGDPINNPFSCYRIKKLRLLHFPYKKMSSFAS